MKLLALEVLAQPRDVRVVQVSAVLLLPLHQEFGLEVAQEGLHPAGRWAKGAVAGLTEGLLELPVDVHLLRQPADGKLYQITLLYIIYMCELKILDYVILYHIILH